MYVNSKINAVLIISYLLCNYVSLIQGKTLAEVLAEKEPQKEHHEAQKLEPGDETLKPVVPSSPVKESESSTPSLEKDQKSTTNVPQQLPQKNPGNQQNCQPNQGINGEQITNVVVPAKRKTIGGLFYSLFRFILGKLIKPKKLSELDIIHDEAVCVFGEMNRTQCVEDKIEKIKKITDFIRKANLYTGRYKDKSKFGKQFDQIEVTPNGDCFYSAISLLFFGEEYFARGLRAITAAHMAINEDVRTGLLPILYEEDLTWYRVLDIRKFAESVEIIFLSNILCRAIKIYESGGRRWYQYDLVGCESPKEPLHLHLQSQHFSALKMKSNFPPVKADIILLPNLPKFYIL